MRIDCSLGGRLVLGRDVHDAVGVDVEGLDLRRGAGMPTRSRWPNGSSAASSRSPWETRMVTAFWPSSAVEKVWPFLARDRRVAVDQARDTLPSVSMPSDSGVTLSSSTSFTSPAARPAWMAAMPTATTNFVRVDALVRFLAEHFLDDPPPWQCALTRLVDLGRLEASVFDGLLARPFGAHDEVVHEALQLGAGELHG